MVLFQDITIEELLKKRASGEITTIDVRSPSEYRNATIPGSLNIPLFDDEERAEVGTIYKQVGTEQAKKRGLEIASAKLPDFIASFQQIEGPKAVFCWRGGMRSKTTATVLSLMGVQTYRLSGGVRAYRQWIVEELGQLQLNTPAFVLNGHTGNGKTLMLEKLQQQGYPVIDLEAMAGHRGSVFGGIGLQVNNQKAFDSLLIERLNEIGKAPYILFEAESRRIGKVEVPAFLLDKKEQGTHLWVELPMTERVRHIMEDYRPAEHKEECLSAFERIKAHIHQPIGVQIEEALHADQYEQAIALLLEYYYDPKYQYSADKMKNAQRIIIQAQNVDEAVEKIKACLAEVSIPQQS